MRKAMTGRGVGERIAALIGVLKTLDVRAAIVAKRMRQRLTRLWPRRVCSGPAAPIASLAVASAFLADSS